jgi:hypothetical protein
VPRVPVDATLILSERHMVAWFREVIDRDPIEQSIAERLVRAVLAIGVLWAAIGWAMS